MSLPVNLERYLHNNELADRFFANVLGLIKSQRFLATPKASFAFVFSISQDAHGELVLRVMTNVENRRQHNVFGLPGGSVEHSIPAESDDVTGRLCAERETLEETGFDLRSTGVTHIGSFALSGGIRYVVYFSEATMPNGNPWRLNKEVSAVCHMRFDNVFSHMLSSNTAEYSCGPHKLRLRLCYGTQLANLWALMYPE